MALNNEQQVRLSVYGFLTFIIIVAGYFYIQIIQQSNSFADDADNKRLDHRPEYLSVDDQILNTQKFKDLRPVIIPTKVSSTAPTSDLTDEQLAKLPRNNDPFNPSF